MSLPSSRSQAGQCHSQQHIWGARGKWGKQNGAPTMLGSFTRAGMACSHHACIWGREVSRAPGLATREPGHRAAAAAEAEAAKAGGAQTGKTSLPIVHIPLPHLQGLAYPPPRPRYSTCSLCLYPALVVVQQPHGSGKGSPRPLNSLVVLGNKKPGFK